MLTSLVLYFDRNHPFGWSMLPQNLGKLVVSKLLLVLGVESLVAFEHCALCELLNFCALMQVICFIMHLFDLVLNILLFNLSLDFILIGLHK